MPGSGYLSVWTPGNDSFGVNQIEVGDITPAGGVIAEPGTMGLAAAGLMGMLIDRRIRR